MATEEDMIAEVGKAIEAMVPGRMFVLVLCNADQTAMSTISSTDRKSASELLLQAAVASERAAAVASAPAAVTVMN